MKVQKADVISHMYFAGLILLCIGLPLSKFLMSVSQFVLLASWLLNTNYKEKLKSFLRNKLALILIGVFVIHLIGLLYSANISEGLKDVRIKLPLLILPFIMATSEPLKRKQFHWLMSIFIAAVTITTLWSMAILFGYTRHAVTDIRDIFHFISISHIRFSLLICVAIFTIFYFVYSDQANSKIKRGALVLLSSWLIVFLFIMESVTGILIFVSINILFIVYFAFKIKKIFLKVSFLLIIIGIPVTAYLFIKKEVRELYTVKEINLDKLEVNTPRGNPYEHQINNYDMENGHRVYLYVSMKELDDEWKKRSRMAFYEKDNRGQVLRYTVIRFLASKGLRKDLDGMKQLSEKEIGSIERGVTNVNNQNVSNIKSRILQILWEYKNYEQHGDPSGHSVAQRLEFWKAAMGIIRENWVIGIGTGDVKAEFDKQYEVMKTTLQLKWRYHAHNQYLSIFVTFGIFGFMYFLVSLVYPLFFSRRYFDYFYFVFWCIAIMSMLTEDTLETQAGATFFAFFNSLFLFAKSREEKPIDQISE